MIRNKKYSVKDLHQLLVGRWNEHDPWCREEIFQPQFFYGQEFPQEILSAPLTSRYPFMSVIKKVRVKIKYTEQA